jgi:putative tricarboxylic transport membrane protein
MTYIKKAKDLFSGLFLFVLGFFLAFGSARLSVWSRFGPSEGFFPLLIAVILMGFSLIIIVKSLNLTQEEKKEKIPDKVEKEIADVFKVSSYIVVIILYGLLLEKVGFLITSILFLFISLKYVEKQGWKMTILVGLASIITSYFLFVHLLGVLLPKGIVKWL